ncbi:MAG: CoA transferase [Sphingomonadaceae bacterium]|nr:CoA transferase [Sphingomonadaceae bacterium]
MTGPLDGVRVLDLTDSAAGAICTMLLADYGSDVVKVEPPTGTAFREARLGTTWDRGKRSIVADPGDDSDRLLVRRLAETADIVLAGRDAGGFAAHGLDYDGLAAANPALVYCRLVALGPREKGPECEGHDLLAIARLGVPALMPGHREGPIMPGSPTLAYSTGLMAAIAILAAVRARLVTGCGDHVEVSHEDGFLAQMSMNWKSERGVSFLSAKARSGQLDMGRTRILLRMFECADNRLVQVHTGAAGAFRRAMEVLEIADRISPTDSPIEMAGQLTESDMEVLKELPAIFRTRTAEEWCDLFWKNEVACLPVQPPGFAFDDPQVRHANVIRKVEDPDEGQIEIVGPVVHMSRSPGEIRGAAPRLGADTATVRQNGWSAPGLDALAGARSLEHPLEDIRIVEFSSWFASPFGNRLLSDLGADVIKVEPLQGDGLRALPDPCEGANRGKRSIALDLKTPQAQSIIRRLLETADVVQNNMRPGVGERLGIDYAAAQQANPAVVYHFAPGYGSTGPKAHLQSFAPLLGGFTGLMTLFGGPGNAPHVGFGNEDYFNGQLVALSVLLGLIHRERTGEGQYLEGPQLHSSLLVTSEWYLKDGEPKTHMPQLDSEQTGFGPYNRIYQCMDGWIALDCRHASQIAALHATVLPPDTSPPGDDAQAVEMLTYEFFCATTAQWIERLRALNIPCEVVFEGNYHKSYLDDDAMLATGRVFESEHHSAGRVRGAALMFSARRFSGALRGRAPLKGENSRAVLHELGFAQEADELIERGIVIDASAVVEA